MVIRQSTRACTDEELQALHNLMTRYSFSETDSSWFDTDKRYSLQYQAINTGKDDLNNQDIFTLFLRNIPIFHGSKIFLHLSPDRSQKYPKGESISIEIHS